MQTMMRYTTAMMILATWSASFVGTRADALAEERTRLVFATGLPSGAGFIGGITGADHVCRESAEARGLEGVFLAWIGDGMIGPANRFEPEEGTLVNVHGDRVARGWRALAAGATEAPVLHLDGSTVAVAPWSNVRKDGTSGIRATACDRWWSVNYRLAGAAGLADEEVVACDSLRPFLCVQQ